MTKDMIDKALKLRGISYIFYTDDNKEYVRSSQPCYGELRKYEITHKGDCTQPHNSKPFDLHSPFPNEGHPVKLIVPLLSPNYDRVDDKTDMLFEHIFSPESPWVSGFKKVDFFKSKYSNHIRGIILNDLSVDPTVLVNSFKVFQNLKTRVDEIYKLIESGLTPNEAILVVVLNGGIPVSMGVCDTNAYWAPMWFSIRRFFEKKPNDLSGGTLQDRVDYNRTSLQNVFLGRDEDGAIRWSIAAINQGLPKYHGRTIPSLKFETIAEKARRIFEDAMKNEKEPIVEPYIWTTTSGKTNKTA